MLNNGFFSIKFHYRFDVEIKIEIFIMVVNSGTGSNMEVYVTLSEEKALTREKSIFRFPMQLPIF